MPMSDTKNNTAHLSAELETALLRELMDEWRYINRTCFHSAMWAPTLSLSDAGSRLGCWIRSVRAIEISRKLVLEHPWGVVLEVLKHEMAHQYVDEVLRPADETAHGPAFQRTCERLGIDPAASGLPQAERTAEEQRVLQRIARLLALAESPNLNEAELAMAEAQRLMLKYNLEESSAKRPSGYGFRCLGRPKGRNFEHERFVSRILSTHFFVETIWVPAYDPLTGKNGYVLEISGAQANLDMAEYVHSFLHRTAERLWEEHKRKRGIKGNRDRQTYLAGVMAGFDEKLTAQGAVHRCEGLVWKGDPGLDAYFRKRHPSIRTTSYQGNIRNAAHYEGRAAGQQIVLNRPIHEHAGSGAGGGRALPPARG
jgi:predicted SprT family Zn-dependent metalloprotease